MGKEAPLCGLPWPVCPLDLGQRLGCRAGTARCPVCYRRWPLEEVQPCPWPARVRLWNPTTAGNEWYAAPTPPIHPWRGWWRSRRTPTSKGPTHGKPHRPVAQAGRDPSRPLQPSFQLSLMRKDLGLIPHAARRRGVEPGWSRMPPGGSSRPISKGLGGYDYSAVVAQIRAGRPPAERTPFGTRPVLTGVEYPPARVRHAASLGTPAGRPPAEGQ